MRITPSVSNTLCAALLTAGAFAGRAQAAPYYDPSNAASSTGNTIGYELYNTIGCPGKGLLEPGCATNAAAKPVAAPKPAPAPAPVVVAPVDSDGDGVPDSIDQCPGTPAGVKVDAKGCPIDSDGDGVPDYLDKCPNTPAGAKVDANGCELDSDGDGVVDRLDKCPNTPAGAKVDANGCELDSDGDGVVDRLDKCPGTPAGTKVDTNGCPVITVINLKGVNFDNDQASLRPDAIAILDQAVSTLKENDKVKVEVAGHTDNRSTAAHNLDLSQRRARAVMDYFVARGVDAGRLSAKGYGQAQPIADNETDAGRAQNRRVELRISN